jgi:hypothetical protein
MWAWRIRYTRGGATGGKRAGGDSIVFGAIKLKAGRGNIKKTVLKRNDFFLSCIVKLN